MEIEFIVMNEFGSAGICDGKEFILIAENGQVYGDLTDGEQLSIFTQWKNL